MVFYDLLYLFNDGRSIIISFTFRKFSGYLFPRYDNITTYFKEKFAFNPKNGNMYVTVGFSNVVSVIDSTSNQVVDTVPVEEGALKIALDPINNDMYVTNTLNNTVSVIG
jgi:YVTN family beta-propeller protein